MNTIKNNVGLATPAHQGSLASSGILVNVRMTTTTLSVADKAVSDEICAQKKADNDAGNFIHKLIGKNEYHQAIMSYRGTIDNWIKSVGYEWGGGWFIIPTFNYPKFRQDFTTHQLEFAKRVDAFIGQYPSILSNIAFKQGDLFDRTKYPDASELRSKFNLTVRTMPVPENDWRVQVTHDVAEDLKNHYQSQHNEVLITIGRAQTEKLVELMKRISKACTVEVSEDGKTRRGRLYDSTIEQALELCDTIASFNPINDTQLEDARRDLAMLLSNMSIPALKESDSLRSSTKENVDSILSKFRHA